MNTSMVHDGRRGVYQYTFLDSFATLTTTSTTSLVITVRVVWCHWGRAMPPGYYCASQGLHQLKADGM